MSGKINDRPGKRPSMIMNILGDLGTARPQAEESAAIFRKFGNQRDLAEALSEAAVTLIWEGKANLAIARLEEALTLYRQAGDRWGEAQVLYRLGGTLVDYSCDSMGRGMLEESAKILADLGEKYLYVYVLISLGGMEIQLGNYASACTHLEQSLAVATEIKHPGGVADASPTLAKFLEFKANIRPLSLALKLLARCIKSMEAAFGKLACYVR